MKPNERIAILSGAFFLFGLAALISLGAVWPGIMLLIILTSLPILLVEVGWRMTLWLGVQMGIWLAGIPFLIALGRIWPGILVLAGLSTLVVAFANPDDLQKAHKAQLTRKHSPYRTKAKRGIPVPPALDDDDILDLQPFGLDDEDDDDEWDDDDHNAVLRRARRG